MAKERQIRCFDYVNHRYEKVRDLLKADAAPALARSAVSRATGPTVAEMAETASAPFMKPRREKRAAMISPMVGLSLRLRAGPSASSRRLVLKGESLMALAPWEEWALRG